MRRIDWNNRVRTAFLAFLLLLLAPGCALAAQTDPCPRPAQGSVVAQPPDLYSQNGVLNVTFGYYTTVDAWGRTLFCYVTPTGQEAPTLHVNPGDTLNISLTNQENGPPPPVLETVSGKSDICGSFYMSPQTTNMHFHGLNVSPKCHGDEVVHTLVNPGQTFKYSLRIPPDEPPGMYWYHQHVHGISSPAVQGGASGAIEVEGIANLQPAVQGLPQRFLVTRDQPLQNPPQNPLTAIVAPFWDVSLNYVPVPYPTYVPGVIQMKAGAKEFWRVVNAAADTIMDLKLVYDGVAQPLQIAALDGVPTGSQDGRHQGTLITQTDILIPPAGRAEFIVVGPSATVQKAQLITEAIDTGPAGDIDTMRPLATIQLTKDSSKIPPPLLRSAHRVNGQRFAGLSDSMVTAHRRLYFSESSFANKKSPGASGAFYITVHGQEPVAYYPDEPPAITTTRGAVEDWIIENRTREVHEFHMHQIHFQVLAVNGVPIPPDQRQFYDMHQVGYWTGTGPYPNIKVRMDFRGAVVGEFVYHCHILDHEDRGMMANILVMAGSGDPARENAQLHSQATAARPTKVGAVRAPAHA